MAFGDLVLRRNSARISEATAVPSNGANTIGLGFAISNSDNFVLEVTANGPSVTDVSWTEPGDGDTSVVVTFTQTGSDSCRIVAHQMFGGQTYIGPNLVATAVGNA